MDFYAVLYKATVYVPGDQRSRDFPGHGYPEHTIERTEVIEFDSKEEFETWVQCEETRTYGKKKYRAIKCTPINISTKVVIDIE